MKSMRHGGYTLLEVLVALLVFSIGLLGLGALLVSAVKGNHQAYHHSQAVYVAEAMADGMRANLAAVRAGNYNTGGLITTHGGSNCTNCSSAQIAARDLGEWVAMANSRLPNGGIGIDCTSGTITPIPAGAAYNGICTINVGWDETGDVGQSESASARTFSWMVQP
jgi:type IV pilus assembly protein PilV